MLRCSIVMLAGVALAEWVVSARAQDDEARALILKAVKAHGGKETLKKHLGAQAKYKGDVEVMGVKAKVEGEIFINFPDRSKNVIGVEINNMKVDIQQGFDGKVLWISVLGKTQEINDKDLIAEAKENMHAEQVAGLIDLDTKDYKLAPLGEMKVMDKPAVGVRVSREGKRDVNLWFDKQSHLLLKSEHRGKDPFNPMGGEANVEKYFQGYKAVMGIQTPARMEVHTDGKKMLDMEITETRYHERLDDTYFAKP
jgi:hypothetical protein